MKKKKILKNQEKCPFKEIEHTSKYILNNMTDRSHFSKHKIRATKQEHKTNEH